jgi:hypothetical protein
MRDLRPIVLVLLIGTVLVGCSDNSQSKATGGSASLPATSGGPSTAAGSTSADTGIPDGNYAKTVTVAQAKAMGIKDQHFLDQLGADGTTTFVFKFAGTRWTEFVVEEVPEPGDGGTLKYDANKDVVMTSESEGCPGCVYTYDWSLGGDQLTLRLVGHDSTDTPEDVVIVRFVTEGAFARQS